MFQVDYAVLLAMLATDFISPDAFYFWEPRKKKTETERFCLKKVLKDAPRYLMFKNLKFFALLPVPLHKV